MKSISFDQAADYYDRTRAASEAAMSEVVRSLASELAGRGKVLEIGVGTGRIALPLLEAGVDVAGIDLSMEMLARLRSKQAGQLVALAAADATRLPFGNAAFGAALASHVFHLIPNWKQAVAEIRRVVRPGGLLLATRGTGSEAEWTWKVNRHFFDEAGGTNWPPGMKKIEELDAHMEAAGVQTRELPGVIDQRMASVNEVIASLEAGIWSACWSYDESTRQRAAAATREWAAVAMGDLEAKREAPTRIVWHAYAL